jgi:hypothetical protein
MRNCNFKEPTVTPDHPDFRVTLGEIFLVRVSPFRFLGLLTTQGQHCNESRLRTGETNHAGRNALDDDVL